MPFFLSLSSMPIPDDKEYCFAILKFLSQFLNSTQQETQTARPTGNATGSDLYLPSHCAVVQVDPVFWLTNSAIILNPCSFVVTNLDDAMPPPALALPALPVRAGETAKQQHDSSTAPAIMLRFSALPNHIIMKLLSCAVIFCCRAPPSAAAGATAGFGGIGNDVCKERNVGGGGGGRKSGKNGDCV